METVMGKHSKKPKDFPKMETVMGKHSHENKNIKEAKEDYGKDFSHLEKHYKITDKHHLDAVDHYSNNSYHMNKKLFGKPVPDDKMMQSHHDAINHMEKHLPGLLKKHTTPHELIVHTGLKVSPHKYFDEGAKHTHVHIPAYTSTSMEHEIAKDFSKVTMTQTQRESHALKLHIPKDAHGAYIGHHSNHPEEHEFLIHHGAVIKIHHKPEITSDKYGVKHHTWHAELVHDGVKKLPGYPE